MGDPGLHLIEEEINRSSEMWGAVEDVAESIVEQQAAQKGHVIGAKGLVLFEIRDKDAALSKHSAEVYGAFAPGDDAAHQRIEHKRFEPRERGRQEFILSLFAQPVQIAEGLRDVGITDAGENLAA